MKLIYFGVFLIIMSGISFMLGNVWESFESSLLISGIFISIGSYIKRENEGEN